MSELLKRLNIDRRKLLMDRSAPGRIGTTLPSLDVPETQLPDQSLLRGELDMPEVSEGEIVRYFSQISQMNFSIDHNFYPLGSCTMKYNPKLNDEIASLPGFAEVHPLQSEETAQGAIRLLWELQELLNEITGMAGCSLAPMAGRGRRAGWNADGPSVSPGAGRVAAPKGADTGLRARDQSCVGGHGRVRGGDTAFGRGRQHGPRLSARVGGRRARGTDDHSA